MDKSMSVPLYYTEIGQGVPLVLLHGFPLSHVIWQPVVELLKDQARLILPDLRGHGQSPAPAGIYPMAEMAGDILALLDRLEIDRAILAGHSMGGYICLAFARLYPRRLGGLGLVATQAASDTPERRQGRYDTAKEVAEKGVQVIADAMAEKLTSRPELVPTIRDWIMATPATGIIGALKGMAERPDSTEMLSEIQVPAVVVAGDQDVLIPLERSEAMAKRLPRSQFFVAPGAGHMPMMETPRLVAEALHTLVQQF